MRTRGRKRRCTSVPVYLFSNGHSVRTGPAPETNLDRVRALVDKRVRDQKILAIMQEKPDGDLREKSLEELRALLAE